MDVADRLAAALEGECVRSLLVEGGEVIEVDGLVVVLTNPPVPELNGTRVAREPDEPRRAMAGGREVFRSRGHPFFGIEIEVGRHPGVEAAIGEGRLARVEAWPAMPVAVARLPDAPPPRGVEIRSVTEPADLDAIRAVETATFGTDPDTAKRFVGASMLEDDRVEMFTAWIEGDLVGEASGDLLDGTVEIFDVSVVEACGARKVSFIMRLARSTRG